MLETRDPVITFSCWTKSYSQIVGPEQNEFFLVLRKIDNDTRNFSNFLDEVTVV